MIMNEYMDRQDELDAIERQAADDEFDQDCD